MDLSNIYLAQGGLLANDDPRLKELVDNGYVSFHEGNGEGSAGTWQQTSKVPTTTANGTPFAFTHMADPAKMNWEKGGGLINPNATWQDPQFGQITMNKNVRESPKTWFDMIGPMVPMLMAGGIGALGGLGAQAGGVGGFAGAQAALTGSGAATGVANTAQSIGNGRFNPMSLASLAGQGLGVPGWATSGAGMAYGLSQGQKPGIGTLGSLANLGSGLFRN